MLLDLIEVNKKNNKYKILIVVLTIILILLASFVAFKIIKKNNSKLMLKESSILARTSYSHEVNFKLPQLTEKGKENIANIYSSEQKRVFLTFDDGPSKTVTPLILDVLKQQNVKANFFLLGSRVEFYPNIVKRTYNEGHYIANHGYSHVYSSIYESPQAVIDEYIRTENCIKKALEDPEYNSSVFRFPGGSVGGKYRNIKREASDMLNNINVSHVDWNSLSGDSEGKRTKEEMLEYVISTSQNKNSVVLLMHDAGDKILTYEVLIDIINYFKENGYVFLTFYDIMK